MPIKPPRSMRSSWLGRMVRIKAGSWLDATLKRVARGLDLWIIVLSTVVCEIFLAEPDTILVFGIYLGVFGDGTRLAMPKTICAPDSSSLNPSLGATEGVLD